MPRWSILWHPRCKYVADSSELKLYSVPKGSWDQPGNDERSEIITTDRFNDWRWHAGTKNEIAGNVWVRATDESKRRVEQTIFWSKIQEMDRMRNSQEALRKAQAEQRRQQHIEQQEAVKQRLKEEEARRREQAEREMKRKVEEAEKARAAAKAAAEADGYDSDEWE